VLALAISGAPGCVLAPAIFGARRKRPGYLRSTQDACGPKVAYLPFRGVSYSGFIALPESQFLSPGGGP